MSPEPRDELFLALQACGISQEDLWIRYFALGGMSRPLELDAIVNDALRTSAGDRDLVVLALNERLRELGVDETIPYSDELPGGEAVLAGAAVASDALRLGGLTEEHAYRDTLTGVLPRDAGQDQLQRAVDQAHRTHQPLVLVFLDVDHLKRTNDSQGHAAGDFLLQSLGSALRKGLRSYDVVVRYGGDEFVCGLPRAGIAQATGRLDKVSAQLHAAVPGASVTAGFAALRDADSLEDVLRRADQDMYANRRAQRSGTAAGDGAGQSGTAEPTAARARLQRVLRVLTGRERRS